MVNIIEKAKEELNTRPLVSLDYMLDAFCKSEHEDTPPQTMDLLGIFSQALLMSAGINQDLWINDPIAGLFNQSYGHQSQRFIAICLLRLLSINDECFRMDSQLRVETFKLFDRVLSNDLYIILNIDVSAQTYEKESKLKDAVPKIESELTDVISSLRNLHVLPNFRQSFMQKLNSQISKVLLWPFLPMDLLEIRLNEVFNAVEQFREERTLAIHHTFAKAKEILQAYQLDSERHGSKYSCEYLGQLADRLLRLMQENVHKSPLAQPATLVIDPSKKKYPFYSQGRDVNLSFIVKNDGPGYAFDVHIGLITDFVEEEKVETYLGDLEPASVTLEIPCRVTSPTEFLNVLGELRWTNFDGTARNEVFQFRLQGQRSDIDWEALGRSDPYSLEPVTTEDELVGRTEILDQLLAQAQAKHVSSAYIFGQKRVGKTSIVKTLKRRLLTSNSRDYLVVYLEGGDYVHPDAKITLEMLGRRLCEEIQDADPRFRGLDVPIFDGALAPLSQFLRKMQRLAPDYRILFILDEFDELPIELYKRGPVGDAFFLTLRSISGKNAFGFILVGGEKMDFILSCQGDTLNRFHVIRVDYFEKEKHWRDFQDLIRRPVLHWFEVSDDALAHLYEQTAGNPYFAKLICRSLFRSMVERRDCHVTSKEIQESTTHALYAVESNSFQHFWEDGILETGPRAEEVSINRRRLLLALGEILRESDVARKEDVMTRARQYRLAVDVENGLREFERRQVLVADTNTYKCKVQFFGSWLKERGIKEIITTFAELDDLLVLKKEEEGAYVRSEEIVRVVEGWGTYKGRRVTEDKVRVWLNQFGDNKNQRLMFRILQNVRFYNADNIRSKMREAHGIVTRGIMRYVEVKKRKRSDILVSYLDSIGKSGAEYAKLYADENEIFYENIVEPGKIRNAIENMLGLGALVFVDDFIGTGGSACEYFRRLEQRDGQILRDSNLRIYLIVVCGFQEAQDNVERVLSELRLPVKVHMCDPLDNSARLFDENSSIFSDSIERGKAKQICYEHGVQLEKKAPLGYGNCQAAIVFPNTCPNNTLPILYEQGKDWIPLFRRL